MLDLFYATASAANTVDHVQAFGLGNSWWAGILDSSWPIMSGVLGLVDGFNPCAMWTLFVLLGFLLSMQDSKKRWLIGAVFISSSAIIYMGALLTYLFGFQEISKNIATSSMEWIFSVVGFLALMTGVITLFNSHKKGVECEVRDVDSKRKFSQKLQEVLNKEKFILVFIGVVILAFSVNAFELLCSFAIPTIFTTTIVSLELPLWKRLLSLVIYDFAYMLDDIIVFTIAMKTLSLKVISPRLVQIANAVGALLLILLGTMLIINSNLLFLFFV